MTNEIRAVIMTFKTDKPSGIDGIPGEIIKAGADTVLQAMKIIIDQIWKTGELPNAWT